MAVRFFVMLKSLKELSVLTDPAFDSYRATKTTIVKEEELEHLNLVERSFFKIAEKSLIKHFRQWLSQDLLPCAIATPETEVSRVFAQYFSGEENIASTSYFSEVHQAEISTSELIEFSKTYGSYRAENRSSLSAYMDAVLEIANGKKLYEEQNNPLVEKLRTFVRYTYLPLACQTQFVESGVKDTAIVSVTGREEQTRTNLAILRSHTVEPFLERARKCIKHRVENEGKKMMPKGWKKNRAVLTGAKRQHRQVNKLIAQGENLNMCTFSLSRCEQYKKQRREETVKKCMDSATRQDNASERTRGITITPYGKGLIRYSFVTTANIHILRTELNLRSVNFDPRTKITALRKLILEDEGVRHNHQYDSTRKSFKPMDISIYQELLAV